LIARSITSRVTLACGLCPRRREARITGRLWAAEFPPRPDFLYKLRQAGLFLARDFSFGVKPLATHVLFNSCGALSKRAAHDATKEGRFPNRPLLRRRTVRPPLLVAIRETERARRPDGADREKRDVIRDEIRIRHQREPEKHRLPERAIRFRK